MERRNRSLKVLDELNYIDSLEFEHRAESLKNWVEQNLVNNSIDDFDLDMKDMKHLSELLYKNISFLKNHREDIKSKINNHSKIREFLK